MRVQQIILINLTEAEVRSAKYSKEITEENR